ncbi:hypothetical protein [Actibacterium sp. D379-3]
MFTTRHTAIAAALFTLSATASLAWTDTAPANPNSIPPRPVAGAHYCPPSTTPMTSGHDVYCGGTVTGRFVQVSSLADVPPGASRVFVIGRHVGAGYQEFDW